MSLFKTKIPDTLKFLSNDNATHRLDIVITEELWSDILKLYNVNVVNRQVYWTIDVQQLRSSGSGLIPDDYIADATDGVAKRWKDYILEFGLPSKVFTRNAPQIRFEQEFIPLNYLEKINLERRIRPFNPWEVFA